MRLESNRIDPPTVPNGCILPSRPFFFLFQLKNCGGGLNDVVSAEPYCAETELTSEDSYVLMACDGVWDVLSDQEAMDFLLTKVALYEKQMREGTLNQSESNNDAPSSSSSSPPTAKANLTKSDWNEILHLTSKALVREALDQRSLDNVTVVIIKLNAP